MKIQFVMSNEEFAAIKSLTDTYLDKLGISAECIEGNEVIEHLNNEVRVTTEQDSKFILCFCELGEALSDKVVAVIKALRQVKFLFNDLIEEFHKKVEEIKARERNDSDHD